MLFEIKVVEAVEVGAFKGTFELVLRWGRLLFKKPYAGPLWGHALLEFMALDVVADWV